MRQDSCPWPRSVARVAKRRGALPRAEISRLGTLIRRQHTCCSAKTRGALRNWRTGRYAMGRLPACPEKVGQRQGKDGNDPNDIMSATVLKQSAFIGVTPSVALSSRGATARASLPLAPFRGNSASADGWPGVEKTTIRPCANFRVGDHPGSTT
jgi:hypothetical protein